MHKVVIMSGCAGSGKSHLADKMSTEVRGTYSRVLSADHYFLDEDMNYKFDPSKLSEAHGACFKKFIETLRTPPYDMPYDLVVVDNTNTTTEEVSPYILGAQAFGYEPEIIQFRVPDPQLNMEFNRYMERCTERNKHGVSYSGVMAQCRRLANFHPLPWWKLTKVESQF